MATKLTSAGLVVGLIEEEKPVQEKQPERVFPKPEPKPKAAAPKPKAPVRKK